MEFWKSDKLRDIIKENCKTLMKGIDDESNKKVKIFYNPDDESGMSYVKSKSKLLKEIGITCEHIPLTEHSELYDFFKLIHDPFMVQLPVHKDVAANGELGIDIVRRICEMNPSLDVDMFGYPEDYEMNPCTPQAVLEIINWRKTISLGLAFSNSRYNSNEYRGLVFTVVGRGNLIGRYLSKELIKRGGTVISINSTTPEYIIYDAYRHSDFIILAANQRAIFNFDHQCLLKDDAMVIDCGVFVNPENGKLEGCVKKYGHKAVEEVKTSPADETLITAVPGGVGPLTVANVAYNAARLLSLHNNFESTGDDK